MAKNDSRSKLLAELDVDEASITPTQNVLITQYVDYWGDYKRETDGKKKREIGKELRSIIKMLDTRKPRKKKESNYKERHAK